MDGKKTSTMLMDEMAMLPIQFKMNGSKFRLDILKMAFANQCTYPKPTVDSLIKDAERLCNWVNNEPSLELLNQK